MAPVRIERKAWSDPRFRILATLAGWGEADLALIRMARLWAHCTEEESDLVEVPIVGAILGVPADRLDDVVQHSRLFEAAAPGVVRVRGCRGRIGWLAVRRAAGRRGAEARWNKRDATQHATTPIDAAQDGICHGKRIADASQTHRKRMANGWPTTTITTPESPEYSCSPESSTAARKRAAPPESEQVSLSKLPFGDGQDRGEVVGEVAVHSDVHSDVHSESVNGRARSGEPTQLALCGPVAGAEPGDAPGAPPDAKTRPRRNGARSRVRPEPGGEPAARFIEAFQAAFLAHHGAKPEWGAKQGRWVNQLVGKPGGLDDALARMRRMFSRAPRWPAESPDLATLRAHWDKFASDAPNSTNAARGGYVLRDGVEYPDGEVDL